MPFSSSSPARSSSSPNADEGDAGAYIDDFLVEDNPFALIEGITIAAQAVGASRGWITCVPNL